MNKYIQQPSSTIYLPITLPLFQYLKFQTPHELNEESLILKCLSSSFSLEFLFVKMAHLAACALVRVTEYSRVTNRKRHLQSWVVLFKPLIYAQRYDTVDREVI